MAEYQSFALGPVFQPPTPTDNTTKARKNYEKELSLLQEFFNNNTVVDQQRVEDTRFAGQDLKALAPFAESLTKYATDVAKQTNKDKVIGQLVDGVMQEDPRISAVEGQTYEFGKRAEGGTKLFTGVANERAFLTDVGATLDADVAALLQSNYMVNYNGQQIPLFQLAQNPATASLAVDFALRQVYKNRGVDYATKAGFVEILSPIHRSVLTNRTTNLISQANSVQQRSNQGALKQQSSAAAATMIQLADKGQLTPEVVGSTFVELADNSLKLNTGLTPSESQILILGQMLATSQRNETLNTLLQDVRLPGGGQRLGDLYPKVFTDDQARIEDNQIKFDRRQAEQLAGDGRQEILQMYQNGAPQSVIDERVRDLTEQITNIDPVVGATFSNGAYTLRGRQQSDLYETTANDIDNGVPVTYDDINALGVSAAQKDALRSRLDQRRTVEDFAGPEVKSKFKTLRASLLNRAGFNLDKDGRYETQSEWFDGGNPQAIEQALENAENDLTRELVSFAQSPEFRRLNPEQQRLALEQKTTELFDEYTGPSGNYSGFYQLLNATNINDKDTQDMIVKTFRKSASPRTLSFDGSRQRVTSRETEWNPGAPVPEPLALDYQRSGGARLSPYKILTYNELEAYGNEYNDTGAWPEVFKQLAQGLGVNPRELWDQQNRVVRTPADVDTRITLKENAEVATPPGVQPGPDLTDDQAKSLSYPTTQWMENQGMSANAGFAGWPYFVLRPKSEWDSLVKEMKASPELWKILSSPYRTRRQNTTALNNWFANRNKNDS